MSHAKNKVDWCLRKAEKELEESGRYKGLVRIKPNKEEAKGHIKKEEDKGRDKRKFYQYGTKLSIDKEDYSKLLKMSKEVISEAKEVVEE